MTDWPVEKMRRMREGGASWRAVGEAFGCSRETARVMVNDYGVWPPKRITPPRETPQQRAFRRYPIAAHKPFFG